jgi:predicted  nucleic acid-binding Zn-ribbon protein
MERRNLLLTVPTIGLTLFPGCTENPGLRGKTSTTRTDGGTNSTDGGLGLAVDNSKDEKVIVNIDIFSDSGARVEEVEIEVDPMGYQTTETGITEPGQYEVNLSVNQKQQNHTIFIGDYQIENNRAVIVMVGKKETRVVVEE